MNTKSSISKFVVDAKNLATRELNEKIREAIRDGHKQIDIQNVSGQRYIAAGIQELIDIEIFGVPGNDLGVFMDGSKVVVHGNAQDATGNTMNSGEIIIHGDVGDITGMSARGGKIFIQKNAGYRTGVHLKEYQGLRPIIVIGGTAQDFLGEYMAGGVIIMLGLNLKGGIHNADYVGTGMHGGSIILRGDVRGIGREVEVQQLDQEDNRLVEHSVQEYSKHFGCKVDEILGSKFKKLKPVSTRPYGNLYSY
jgi:glutamate synthase domain-containing protein 3|tara:strand:+ start:2965 stop:3717 length:753 start_codon:yes stop_codon:yes gene_type:complete